MAVGRCNQLRIQGRSSNAALLGLVEKCNEKTTTDLIKQTNKQTNQEQSTNGSKEQGTVLKQISFLRQCRADDSESVLAYGSK